MINPDTDGTNPTEAGVCLLENVGFGALGSCGNGKGVIGNSFE